MAHSFYADESGDLGWKFDAPYGKGGSSRYLVIACASMPSNEEHRPERAMRDLYKASKWDSRKEKKWTDISPKSKQHFVQKAVQLRAVHPQVEYHAIVVCKRNVSPHLRDDGNKLYNYMLRRLLVNEMAKHADVLFYPDPRSIKVESGNSMHDYLSIWLGFELGVPTRLNTQRLESQFSKCLQFTDMLSGVVHTHYEFKNPAFLKGLGNNIRVEELFFPCPAV